MAFNAVGNTMRSFRGSFSHSAAPLDETSILNAFKPEGRVQKTLEKALSEKKFSIFQEPNFRHQFIEKLFFKFCSSSYSNSEKKKCVLNLAIRLLHCIPQKTDPIAFKRSKEVDTRLLQVDTNQSTIEAFTNALLTPTIRQQTGGGAADTPPSFSGSTSPTAPPLVPVCSPRYATPKVITAFKGGSGGGSSTGLDAHKPYRVIPGQGISETFDIETFTDQLNIIFPPFQDELKTYIQKRKEIEHQDDAVRSLDSGFTTRLESHLVPALEKQITALCNSPKFRKCLVESYPDRSKLARDMNHLKRSIDSASSSEPISITLNHMMKTLLFEISIARNGLVQSETSSENSLKIEQLKNVLKKIDLEKVPISELVIISFWWERTESFSAERGGGAAAEAEASVPARKPVVGLTEGVAPVPANKQRDLPAKPPAPPRAPAQQRGLPAKPPAPPRAPSQQRDLPAKPPAPPRAPTHQRDLPAKPPAPPRAPSQQRDLGAAENDLSSNKSVSSAEGVLSQGTKVLPTFTVKKLTDFILDPEKSIFSACVAIQNSSEHEHKDIEGTWKISTYTPFETAAVQGDLKGKYFKFIRVTVGGKDSKFLPPKDTLFVVQGTSRDGYQLNVTRDYPTHIDLENVTDSGICSRRPRF